MKKLTLILFLSVSVFVFSQEKDNQNVELPEFVITGTEKVSVDKVKKAEPDLISITSEDYFKPEFSPEELELKKFSNPLKQDINYYDSVFYKKGYLDAAAGINKLASGKFFYSLPFSGGIINSSANAVYNRAYVPNADKFAADGFIQVDFFSGEKASFLPGSNYKVKADYGFNSYKIFASGFPEVRRNFNDFTGMAGYRNFESKNFQMSLDAGVDYTLYKEVFKDRMFFVSGYANLQTENFLLSLETKFKQFDLSNTSVTNDGSSFFSFMPKLGLRISDMLKADFGAYFSQGAGLGFNSPYVSLALKIDKKASLYLEYDPHAEYVNAAEYLKINPYLDLRSFYNQYIDYITSFTFGVKYEYEKYFQINAGVNYKTSDNFKYFTASAVKGYFDVASVEGKQFNGFLDLLYHLGPFGYFYGRTDFKVASSFALTIPYIPVVTSNAAYGYSFKRLKLDTEIGFVYKSSVYTDLTNFKELPSFFDLRLKLVYTYKPDFLLTLEVSNILNQEHFIWQGYKELPINLSAGIRILL